VRVFTGEFLILVIPAPDYNLCGGKHGAESATAFYAIAPIIKAPPCLGDDTYDVISHEVFEAAGNPANGGIANGWSELVDGCKSNMPVTIKSAARVHDNTQDGACSTTDVTVQVLCFSPGGTPADAPFTLTFRRKADLMGRFAHDHAYAWAHGSSGSFADANQYNTQWGNLSMTRTGAGQYIVTVPNQNNVGGNVQVTAVGTGPERCKVGKWYVTGSDQAIHVGCFSASGLAADSDFIFSYIGGDWPFIKPICINCPPQP
jgi:hypothetical protein